MTPFEPSKNTGGQNFTRLLLDDLSQGNEIDLVMFLNDKTDYEIPSKNVKLLKIFYVRKWQKLINTLLLPICFPFFSCRFNLWYLLSLYRIVKTNKYDVIYIDYSQLFIFGLLFKNEEKVLMSHDVIYQHYQRKSSQFILRFCKLSEGYILRKQRNSKIFTFSYKDSKLLNEEYGIESDVTNFYIDIPYNREIKQLYNRIVFFGSWKRSENLEGLVWFIDNIYDKLNPDIDIVVIGGGLSQFIIDQIKEKPNIRYLDFLSDPYQIISESKLLIAPIFHGAGVKVKVIEALASGTAIIGTDVAFEGIPFCFEPFMHLAENAGDFVDLINNFQTTIKEKQSFRMFFIEQYMNSAVSKYINNLKKR